MMAQTTGLEPGTLSYSIKDAHIYINQIDKIELMINITRLLSKENYKEDIKTLKLNDKRRK